jgi:hypothetical protein
MGIARVDAGAPPVRPTGHEELIGRLVDALGRGQVDAADIERLLSGKRPPRRGPGAPAVLAMLGAVVVFSGLAIAFGTVFEDLPFWLQVIAPFAFPAAAAAGCAWLHARGWARWQTELTGLLAYAAFAGACVASGWASGLVDTDRQAGAYVAAAALPAGAMVAALSVVTGSALLLWAGGPAVLAALGLSLAELAGVLTDDSLPWIVLAEAGLAAAAGALLLRRGRADGRYAFVWAAAGAYAAVVFSPGDLNQFGIWHLILAAVVIAAFLLAAATDFGALIWIAAAGGAFWVVLIALVVGSATGAALAVVLAGIGLLGLAVLVARLRRAPRGTPP